MEPTQLRCWRCMSPLPYEGAACKNCGARNASLHNESHQLPCGCVLADRFLIGYALGEGGFGITYVGWDIQRSRKVAVKEYYPDGVVARSGESRRTIVPLRGRKGADFIGWRNRFAREAQTLAKFSGIPNIVNVREYFAENNTAYIVMDFVEGKTLRTLAEDRGGKLPVGEVLRMMQPVMAALAHVHEQGLLHRDISPDNIILQPDGTVTLIDFGSAREISADGERSSTVNVKHGYAPEEQYRRHGKQGPWTDVYALCATIYKLTTGRTPPQALDRLTGDDPLVPPNKLGADFTRSQQDALLKGMSIDAEDRPQDMQTLRQSFRRSAQSQGFSSGSKKKWRARSNSGIAVPIIRLREHLIYRAQQRKNRRGSNVWTGRMLLLLGVTLLAAGMAVFLLVRQAMRREALSASPTPGLATAAPLFTSAPTPKATPSPAPTAVPEEDEAQSGMVTAAKVNLREKPDLTSDVLAVLDYSTPLTVYRRDGDFYYVKVTQTGVKGYAYAQYISVILDGAATPTLTPKASPTPTLIPTITPDVPFAETSGYVSRDQVNLRAAPNTSATIVDVLGYQTYLTILGKEGNFYRVTVKSTGDTGYVHENYVYVKGGPTPVVAVTPSPSPSASLGAETPTSGPFASIDVSLSGGSEAGSSRSVTFTVKNTGSETVTGYSVQYTGYDANGERTVSAAEKVDCSLPAGASEQHNSYGKYVADSLAVLVEVRLTKVETATGAQTGGLPELRIKLGE